MSLSNIYQLFQHKILGDLLCWIDRYRCFWCEEEGVPGVPPLNHPICLDWLDMNVTKNTHFIYTYVAHVVSVMKISNDAAITGILSSNVATWRNISSQHDQMNLRFCRELFFHVCCECLYHWFCLKCLETFSRFFILQTELRLCICWGVVIKYRHQSYVPKDKYSSLSIESSLD